MTFRKPGRRDSYQNQSVGWRAGRNHQWRGGQVPCRLQANGYIAPVPADGGLGGKETELRARAPILCVLPRAVPIVEAMTNLVVVDHWMRHAQNRIFSF